MKANKLLWKQCIGYWFCDIYTQEKEGKTKDIPIVCEFSEVFPEELQGLSPQREIDFDIELIPSAQLISKVLYCMGRMEFGEQKIPLDKPLQKGFIRPSVSP